MSHRCAPPPKKNENDGKQSFNKSNKKQMVLAIPNGIIESGFEYSVLTVNSFKYLAGGGVGGIPQKSSSAPFSYYSQPTSACEKGAALHSSTVCPI